MGNWPKVAGPTDCNHFLPPPSTIPPTAALLYICLGATFTAATQLTQSWLQHRRGDTVDNSALYSHYHQPSPPSLHCTTHIRYVDICVVNDWLMQEVRQQWIVMNKGPLTWHINEEWSVTMMININPSYPCKMGTYEVHTISRSRDSWHPWRLDHHLSADGGENIYTEWKYLYGSSNRVLLC